MWNALETWLLRSMMMMMMMTYSVTPRFGLKKLTEVVCFLSRFFVAVEEQVCVLLPTHITKNDISKDIKRVINDILKDDNVQFYWTLVASDIESDNDAQELLNSLWVTVRGFSIASAWLEKYKQVTKQTTAKSTGLRKHLS